MDKEKAGMGYKWKRNGEAPFTQEEKKLRADEEFDLSVGLRKFVVYCSENFKSLFVCFNCWSINCKDDKHGGRCGLKKKA